MQNYGDEWGQADLGSQRSSASRAGGGGWNWLFTLTAIVIVAVFSMGMAWLTRNVDERPVWMMGLIFMVPTAALMLGTMMVEGATSYMTPGTSRKPQIRLAIIVSAATFLVACICDLIYLQGFKKELAPAGSTITKTSQAERLILIWDNTASMNENGAHDRAVQTGQNLLDQMPENVQIAMISDDLIIPFAPVSADQRQRIEQTMRVEPSTGRMYYGNAFDAALQMIRESGTDDPVRVVFFSDGLHIWDADGKNPRQAVLGQSRITVYWVNLGSVPTQMEDLLRVPGKGILVEPEKIEDVLDGIVKTGYTEAVKAAEIPKDIRLQQDLIRNRDQSAIIITCIMMILEGLSLGICLSLMYSSAGQFRAQYIISPLMGVLSFILLKFVMSTEDMSTWWVREGICFSLLGVVMMTKNRFIRGQSSAAADNWTTGSDSW